MSSSLPITMNDPRSAALAATTISGAKSGSGAGSSSSSTASPEFSASDFMKLLVTEMKNQDPTQPTDPTQYVQQLVGVNSLQQLIQINQGINEITSTTTQS